MRGYLTRLPLRQHKVEDQLLPPQDDTLDHVEGEHAQAVQNVDALFEQGHVCLVITRLGLLHDHAKLNHLRQARLPRYDSSDCALNRGLLLLEILDFLDDDRAVLLRGEPVDAVKEDGAMVVGDKVRLPRLEQLLFKAVHHVR